MINNSKATHKDVFYFSRRRRKKKKGERKRWRMMKEGKNKIKEKRDAMAGGPWNRPITTKLSQTLNILKGGWGSLCSLYVVATRFPPLNGRFSPTPIAHAPSSERPTRTTVGEVSVCVYVVEVCAVWAKPKLKIVTTVFRLDFGHLPADWRQQRDKQ